mgnify:CR=1 FL=1
MSNEFFSTSNRIKETPFTSRNNEAGVKKYSVYNNTLIPTVFKSLKNDYLHLTKHVQLWDVCCQKIIEIKGKKSHDLLKYLFCRDLSNIIPGRAYYSPIVNFEGGILNDPVVFCLGESHFLISLSDSDLFNWVSAINHTMNFNADGKYAYKAGTSATFGTKSATFEVWIYPGASELTSGDRGTVILVNGGSGQYMSWNKDNSYLSTYWYSHPTEGYHETVGPSARSAWHHWCSAWDYQSGRVFQYTNGVNSGNGASQGDATPGQNINIGRESVGRQFSGGIAVVRIYNRALSGDEVFQNFTAEKSRFGI